MPLSQKQEIIARWLVWLPYENGAIENKEFTLQLTGCPVGNPANSLCFSKKLEGETEVCGLEFSPELVGLLEFFIFARCIIDKLNLWDLGMQDLLVSF